MILGGAASHKPVAQVMKSQRARRIPMEVVLGAVVVLLLLIALGGAPARAQSTFGSIRGNVEDVSGAAVSGAQVILHSIDENTDRKVAQTTPGIMFWRM